jgi:uncharacterized protein YcnI
MKRNWMGLAIALAGLTAAGPAIAHIVLAVREAPAGSYYKAGAAPNSTGRWAQP